MCQYSQGICASVCIISAQEQLSEVWSVHSCKRQTERLLYRPAGAAQTSGIFRLGISALKDMVAEKIGGFDTFASVPTSGLVFGSALAYEMNKPFIYVRKEPKAYGTSKTIEGFLEPASKVIIVDDVATTE